MKRILILLMFILTLSFINVFADIRAPGDPPTPRITPPPSKESKTGGFCYAPTVIAGILLSFGIISFGQRFIRYRQTPLKIEGSAN